MRPFSETELGPRLPQDIDAERAILGAVLINNGNLSVATAILNPGDFFHEHHRLIFGAMLVVDATTDLDLITLSNCLRGKGKLETVGGSAYLASLVDGVPRVSHLERYARIVKDKSLLRSLIHATRAIQQTALEAEEDPCAILEQAKASIASIERDSSLAGQDLDQTFDSFEEFENSRQLTFAIDSFLQTDAATMIAGLSGHDKTFIMLSMVKSLLTGARLWDLFDVNERAARCVYLIPESSRGPFKHRLELFGLMEYVRNQRLLVRTLSKGPTPSLSDSRILSAANGADIFLDTAVRFSTQGSENDAADNQRGLAADIFALLGSGARLVVGAHHAPKSFAKETVMSLENILRGSGDIGAMLATCWGVRQLDAVRNVVYIQNVKPRDFEPCGPFQLIGRPHIDQEGDFKVYKRPGESGFLQDELDSGRNQGGAPPESRQQRASRIQTVREWLSEDPGLTVEKIRGRLKESGIEVSLSAVKNYRHEAQTE